VDLVGIEPTTSSMPWKRAPSCATGPFDWRVLINSYARALVSQTFSPPKSPTIVHPPTGSILRKL
jgi:hypothetical protein